MSIPGSKLKYLRSVYLSDRVDHPGANMVLEGDKANSHLIGGEIKVLPQPKNAKFGKYVLTPREVRKVLAEKGCDAAVAFQTRNPLHRAHEYALVYGLETLIRDGKNALAVLNPLIRAETKGDDVNAEIRMATLRSQLIQSSGSWVTATAISRCGVRARNRCPIELSCWDSTSRCFTAVPKKR